MISEGRLITCGKSTTLWAVASSALELANRAKEGDAYAGMLWNAMIYQIEKCIGAMAAGAIRVLNGEEELKEYTGKLVWDGFAWDK